MARSRWQPQDVAGVAQMALYGGTRSLTDDQRRMLDQPSTERLGAHDDDVRLVLPWPPSVNSYWRTIPGRKHPIISEVGRQYRDAVHARVIYYQARGRIGSRRAMAWLLACPPDRRRRDLDNLCKALLDGLQHARVYDDDEQIDDLRVIRGPVSQSPGGAVYVALRPIADFHPEGWGFLGALPEVA